jgi:chaperonin GroES
MTPTHGGDSLARGAARADFGMAGLDEQKWKMAFGEESLKKLNAMDEKERNKLIEEANRKVAEIEAETKPTSKSKIRSVQDRIWVTRLAEEEKVGDLFVPDESKEKPAKGTVVAVGPGKWVNGNFQAPSIAVGDKVIFGKFAGAEVQVGFEHYLVLREEDIFGVEEQN